jgi:hypothetical protein
MERVQQELTISLERTGQLELERRALREEAN